MLSPRAKGGGRGGPGAPLGQGRGRGRGGGRGKGGRREGRKVEMDGIFTQVLAGLGRTIQDVPSTG